MNIIFLILRNVIVKYHIYIININSSCCYISCYKYVYLAASKVIHYSVTLLLFHITMYSISKITSALKL